MEIKGIYDQKQESHRFGKNKVVLTFDINKGREMKHYDRNNFIIYIYFSSSFTKKNCKDFQLPFPKYFNEKFIG